MTIGAQDQRPVSAARGDLFGALEPVLQVPGAAPGEFTYVDGFLQQREAQALMADLLASVRWREEYLTMFGRRLRSPRQVAWCGDSGVRYRYSGETHKASGWLPALHSLRERVQRSVDHSFNFVLLNLYHDGSDSMSWHADDEPELGPQPVIASVSLGASRPFRIRPTRAAAGERRKSTVVDLAEGDLLVMRGNSQRDFQHSLPKLSRRCAARINLTFRQVNG